MRAEERPAALDDGAAIGLELVGTGRTDRDGVEVWREIEREAALDVRRAGVFEAATNRLPGATWRMNPAGVWFLLALPAMFAGLFRWPGPLRLTVVSVALPLMFGGVNAPPQGEARIVVFDAGRSCEVRRRHDPPASPQRRGPRGGLGCRRRRGGRRRRRR